MIPRDVIPAHWTEFLGAGPIGWGLDLGTTTKKTSNPTALVVMEGDGRRRIERLVARWKTDNPDVTEQIMVMVCDDVKRANKRFRKGCVDASNETFYAKQLRKRLLGRVSVELVKGGETIEWQGETYNYKELLGLLYAQLYEENMIFTPSAKWMADDRRLVKREAGQFVTELGEGGAHGDTFDGGKLANWSLRKGSGPVEAVATAVGQWAGKLLRPGTKHPHAHLHQRRRP